ncbi:MAG: CPBP family intramembrane metalloprotease [Bacillota bacterium]|nr:CPBP family intramembrane metalloprotease [Bacillota bacterium]
MGGLLLSLLNILLSSLMLWILPESLSQEQSVLLILDQANTPLKMFLVFIQLLILAPLGEELLFRAFLYPALLKRLKIWPAILLSSLIFAALHLNLAAFLPLFIGGLGFNIIYARWGNLLYCAVAHAIWNGVSLLVYFLS